jgi:hypothetical protein
LKGTGKVSEEAFKSFDEFHYRVENPEFFGARPDKIAASEAQGGNLGGRVSGGV